MPLNLIITGVGGQGNVLASQILGRTAVQKGLKVTIGETFGLSQRGGPVMSHIRFSKDRNYGPLIPPNMAHIIVGLEPLEVLRILVEYGNDKTVILVNSRPIYPLNVTAGEVEYPDPEKIRQILKKSADRVFWLDATKVAVDSGGPFMLNMIILGALSKVPGFPLAINDIEGVLSDFFSESVLEANFRALSIGGGLIQDNEN